MFTLYRYYNSSNILLYIGLTNKMSRREYEHSLESPWYSQSSYVTVEHFEDAREAAHKENIAISLENPLYNKDVSGLYAADKRNNPDGIVTIEEFIEYRERVVNLRERFLLLGRGSRARCSYDIQISPTRIGYVLCAKHIDFVLLGKIETWMSTQELPQDLYLSELVAVG